MNSIYQVDSTYYDAVKIVRSMIAALVVAVALLVQTSSAAAMPASVARIVGVAAANSSDLLGLVLICAVMGVVLLADRRRRSRARTSAA